MKHISIFILFLLLNSKVFSQIKNLEKYNYSITPIQKNEMDTPITNVSGFLDIAENISVGKYFIIILKSDNKKDYTAISDSLYRFTFGNIAPGVYKIIASTIYTNFKGIEPIYTTLDSVIFKRGVFYDLQIHVDLFKNSGCCYVGKQFHLPISFMPATNELTDESKYIIEDLSNLIRKNNLKVEVAFHADERINESNSSIDTCSTCTRAEKVKNYMISLGVEPERIIAKGFQGRKPYFIHAKTENQHQLNRRVVITILPLTN